MNEKPTWEHGSTVKSLYGVMQLGKKAVATVLGSIDTKLANSCNGEDDERD